MSNSNHADIVSCIDHTECATFDLKNLILTSKPWSCEIRVDLFAPLLGPARLKSKFVYLKGFFKNLETIHFGLPYFWNIQFTLPLGILGRVLVSRVPVSHVFILPPNLKNIIFNDRELMETWASGAMRCPISDTTNIQMFLLDLIEKDGQYSPHTIHHFSRAHDQDSFSETDLHVLQPDSTFKLLEQIWSKQIHWSIMIMRRDFRKNFDACDNLVKVDSTGGISASDIFYQAVVSLWQSVLRNYTYMVSGSTVCSNGMKINAQPEDSRSIIAIDEVFLRRYLHIPMQIANPVNGSFRFVVCVPRGSEKMAFGELVNVYDKIVWGTLAVIIFCAALLWKYLLSAHANSKLRKSYFRRSSFIGRVYTLLKILLEQGDDSFESVSIPDRKVSVFLGIFLTMCVILSNGYKNANVYKMVKPRKLIMYERLDDLIQDNFSIYTISHPYINPVKGTDQINWFSEVVILKRLSGQVTSYYIGNPEKDAMTVVSRLGEILSQNGIRISGSYFGSKGDIELYHVVQNKTQIYLMDILKIWINRLKKKFKSWAEVLNWHGPRFYFLPHFVMHEHASIEREGLVPLLNSCEKTALVLYSNEAEVYSGLLTLKRGSLGKETYFQHYFLFNVGGLVTTPFLSRLARIKESGIVEWWTNVTKHVSLVQLHHKMPNNAFQGDDHPSGATMEGNVVVIFTTLLSGQGLAAIGFTLEILVDSMLSKIQK